MHERHEHEQYFFLPETVTELADFAAGFARPCCLCAPTVGAELAARGAWVRVLDLDERFAGVRGFVPYDLYRPRALDEDYDLILCDPPFHKVSPAQLFDAIRTLARGAFPQPLLVCYPREREAALLGTFAPFGLVPTGYFPRYISVQAHAPGDIQFYGNLPITTPGR
ncbi:MAG: hypothetical protein KIT31_10465 [Deltaproteobacteria bacterium]|nr:hypothetical protein [Deltaproteobacteria bacterium]